MALPPSEKLRLPVIVAAGGAGLGYWMAGALGLVVGAAVGFVVGAAIFRALTPRWRGPGPPPPGHWRT